MAIKAAIFDAYGTLLDVASATNQLVKRNHYPGLAAKADTLTRIWRAKQLEYSWLRSLMGTYIPFWDCTRHALDYALAETGLADDPELRAELLSLYRVIDAYDDGKRLLAELAQIEGVGCAILSNGNQEMLDEAVGAAGLTSYLDHIISVEEVGIFKPAPEVYAYGCRLVDAAPEEVLFFSSNGWDIAGAGQFGYQTIWVNRAGQQIDQLDYQPRHIVSTLDEAWQIAQKMISP